MPDQMTDRARKAAEEIAREFLAEPCREVDDDGKICAWKYDDADVEKIAAVIERHCRECVEEKNKNIERIRRFNESEIRRFAEDHKEDAPCPEK